MIFFILFLSLYVSYAFHYSPNNRHLNNIVSVKIKNTMYEYNLPMWVENDIFQQNVSPSKKNCNSKNTERKKRIYRKFPKFMEDDYEIPLWVHNKVFKTNIPGVFKNKKQTLKNLNRML